MTPAEMFDALPQEIKEEMRRAAREKFKDNEGMLKFMEFEEDLYAINNQICNALGLMKRMLSRFDERGTSNDHALSNLKFFSKFMMITTPTMRNIGENVSKFHEKYVNETKNGGNHDE